MSCVCGGFALHLHVARVPIGWHTQLAGTQPLRGIVSTLSFVGIENTFGDWVFQRLLEKANERQLVYNNVLILLQ